MRFHIEVVKPERCIACYDCVYACSRHLFNEVNPAKTAVFVKVTGGVTAPELVICKFCKDPECAAACPKGALQPLPEGGITLITAKCKDCKFECVAACVIRAIVIDKDTGRPIICDRCGDCAKYCPHNVFKYEEMR